MVRPTWSSGPCRNEGRKHNRLSRRCQSARYAFVSRPVARLTIGGSEIYVQEMASHQRSLPLRRKSPCEAAPALTNAGYPSGNDPFAYARICEWLETARKGDLYRMIETQPRMFARRMDPRSTDTLSLGVSGMRESIAHPLTPPPTRPVFELGILHPYRHFDR